MIIHILMKSKAKKVIITFIRKEDVEFMRWWLN